MKIWTTVAVAILAISCADVSMAQGPGQGKQRRAEGQDRGQRLGKLLSRFDADKNGTLSAEEAPERMKQYFAVLDANSDGQVTAEELQSLQGLRGRGQGDGAGRGKGQGRGQGKGARGLGGEKGGRGLGGEKGARGPGGEKGARGQGGQRSIDPATLIARFDTDKDGQVSSQEAPERMKSRFAKLDANSDGFVTVAEFQAALDKRGSKGAKGRNKGDSEGSKKAQRPKRPPMEAS